MAEPAGEPEIKTGGRYAHYVLVVLVLVYIFNFIDRNILSILAEDIKADLGIDDAQMGFLYGTVFAVFYAVFGIPLARFADVWTRRSLVSVGLAFWSFMTAASGLARSFGMLAACRIGVGIGEASASPAAYSMLADYYPPRLRATVIAIYAAGVYIGAGIGIFLGGYILEAWSAAYPIDPPFGLKGWQVAFMAVGIPGLVMAIWVRTLREPTRGISEGLVASKHPHPFRLLGHELMAVLPPFNLYGLRSHPKILRNNLLYAMGFALAAWGLIWLTGSVAQWITTGFGVWVTLTWSQSLKIRDPVTYQMMFGSKAFVYTMLAFPSMAFIGYGAGFWIPPLLLRVHDVGAAEVGLYLGLGAAGGGFLGITLGGVLRCAGRQVEAVVSQRSSGAWLHRRCREGAAAVVVAVHGQSGGCVSDQLLPHCVLRLWRWRPTKHRCRPGDASYAGGRRCVLHFTEYLHWSGPRALCDRRGVGHSVHQWHGRRQRVAECHRHCNAEPAAGIGVPGAGAEALAGR
jgi:MFS family permease